MKLSRLFLVFVIGISFLACHHVHDVVTTKTDPKFDYAANGYIKAMVTDVQLDGCKFMLQPEGATKKLEPDQLLPEFQQDSLNVWLKYVDDDRMSVCMAGQTIKVIDIRKR